MKAKRSSPRWLVGCFTAAAAKVVGHGESLPTRGTAIRASGSGVGGDGSEPSFPREPTSHGTSTSTRPPIGSDTSSSRSWAGTRSIVPWAPVKRNSQSTMLLYGWWPLWTRPSIGYSQTERSRQTHTPCGIHLTNEKQSLGRDRQTEITALPRVRADRRSRRAGRGGWRHGCASTGRA